MTLQHARSGLCVLLAAAALIACAGSGDERSIEPSATTDRPPDSVVEGPEPTADATTDAIDELVNAGRVDLASSGNRVIEGPGGILDLDPVVVDAPVADATAVWIAPGEVSEWVVVLSDGSLHTLSDAGDSEAITRPDPVDAFDPSLGPPLVTGTGSETQVTGHDAVRSLFVDPLPDTRVTTDGSQLVAIGGATDRYAHGVLGDDLEGSTIEVIGASGARDTPVTIDDPDVFETVSPMLADVDDDGDADAVMTVSNADSGARLVAYDLASGSIVAESEPIGQGNRWRNLLAVAPTGPEGETEVIDIRTPHIGGTLQFFQLVDGRLELVASTGSYSTHRIGSRNLDLGIVTDADGDGDLDVLLPTQDATDLAVVTRDAASETGTREVGRVALGGEITSNIAAAVTERGVAYAVGVSDGTIRFWLP